MSYVPHTQEEREEMLRAIGVSSIEELFADIGEELRPKSFNLPEGRSEYEVKRHLEELAEKNNTNLTSFLGAGVYDHYIPAAVDALAGRSEFYTAYTPYQPECSQGILQAMYEFQTAICLLTGMDVANASLYDGGTALCEAVMMALRITGRKRIIIEGGVTPIYQRMLFTYAANLAVEINCLPSNFLQAEREAILNHLDKDTAAIILQNPNFFGTIDDHTDIVSAAHKAGALVIQVFYPVALGLLKTPGEMGVDIAVAEGQCLGLPLSFGGPYLGLMTCKKEFMRKMPGRIVGATVDKEGKRGFVLTLQTREQHIRRQRATSNICTNAALCALRAVIFLSLLGKKGIKELAALNYHKSEFAKKALREIAGVEVVNTPTFNEFVIRLKKDAEAVTKALLKQGVVPGLPLGRFYKDRQDCLLVTVTEKRTKEDILKLAEGLKRCA